MPKKEKKPEELLETKEVTETEQSVKIVDPAEAETAEKPAKKATKAHKSAKPTTENAETSDKRVPEAKEPENKNERAENAPEKKTEHASPAADASSEKLKKRLKRTVKPAKKRANPKKKNEIQDLIEKGKAKGSLTNEEILEIVDHEDLDVENMEKLLEQIESLGIETKSPMTTFPTLPPSRAKSPAWKKWTAMKALMTWMARSLKTALSSTTRSKCISRKSARWSFCSTERELELAEKWQRATNRPKKSWWKSNPAPCGQHCKTLCRTRYVLPRPDSRGKFGSYESRGKIRLHQGL